MGLWAVALTGYCVWRVTQLERGERSEETAASPLRARMLEASATRISARLGSARIDAGQFAVFELCAAHDLAGPAFVEAFDIAVLHLEARQLMLRVPLDRAHLAHVNSTAAGSCLFLGSGTIEHAGTYTVEAVWHDQPPTAAEVLDNPLVQRVLVKTPLSRLDLAAIAALGLLVLGSVSWLLISAPAVSSHDRRAPTWLVLVVPTVALALVYCGMQWPSSGALRTTCKGLLLLALQCAVAIFAARTCHTGLALVQPHKRYAWLGALVAWPLLIASARLALRVVPSTAEAPLETFISWPSGMLAAALLGVLLPIGEELFFRGFLLGVWTRFGSVPAFVGSTLVFGALHTQQSWGNWGGLLAVFVTGAVLGGLRVWSGSTWIVLLSHVAYNLTLSLSSIGSAL